MNITDVRVYLKNGGDHLKAYASVTLDAAFAVKDLRVVEGQHGLFVSMPARKDGRGRYWDVAHAITREFHDELQARVLEEYQKAAGA
jgi:stage V sporulation protein G